MSARDQVDEEINSRPYSVIARQAMDEPNIWTYLRKSQKSANLVTFVKQNRIPEMPSHLFEARSQSRIGDGGDRLYSIEVRYLGVNSELDALESMTNMVMEKIRPAIRQALQEALGGS